MQTAASCCFVTDQDASAGKYSQLLEVLRGAVEAAGRLKQQVVQTESFIGSSLR